MPTNRSLTLFYAVERVHHRLGLGDGEPAWPLVLNALRTGEITAFGQTVLIEHDGMPAFIRRAGALTLRMIFQGRVLERRQIADITRDWWWDESVPVELRGEIDLHRTSGENVESLQMIQIAESEIDRAWPEPHGGTLENVATMCPISDKELRTFLNMTADGCKTEAQVKKLIESHFDGRSLPRAQWRAAWKGLPSERKLARGDTAHTLKCKSSRSLRA